MSVEIIDVSEPILTLRVSGSFAQAKFATAQRAIAAFFQQPWKVRLLVLIEDVVVPESVGDSGETTFPDSDHLLIEKIALVGDQKWEDVAVLFTGKGVRRVPIEYFSTADLAKAKTWLAA